MAAAIGGEGPDIIQRQGGVRLQVEADTGLDEGCVAVGARPFDGEGLPTAPRALVEDGRLTGWLMDSAAARQLGDTLEWLFKEAFEGHCGRVAVMDRLFELLVILLLQPIQLIQRLQTSQLLFRR